MWVHVCVCKRERAAVTTLQRLERWDVVLFFIFLLTVEFSLFSPVHNWINDFSLELWCIFDTDTACTRQGLHESVSVLSGSNVVHGSSSGSRFFKSWKLPWKHLHLKFGLHLRAEGFKCTSNNEKTAKAVCTCWTQKRLNLSQIWGYIQMWFLLMQNAEFTKC